jgi:hypothetical protein
MSNEEFIWVTREGQFLKMGEISDDHLLNIIRWLRYRLLIDEARIDEEGLFHHYQEKIKSLEAEAETRNLKG